MTATYKRLTFHRRILFWCWHICNRKWYTVSHSTDKEEVDENTYSHTKIIWKPNDCNILIWTPSVSQYTWTLYVHWHANYRLYKQHAAKLACRVTKSYSLPWKSPSTGLSAGDGLANEHWPQCTINTPFALYMHVNGFPFVTWEDRKVWHIHKHTWLVWYKRCSILVTVIARNTMGCKHNKRRQDASVRVYRTITGVICGLAAPWLNISRTALEVLLGRGVSWALGVFFY